MSLQELKSNVPKKRKTVGRGNGSGRGTYSGKGGKGQTARSGGNRRPGFEGGQTPYLRRIPKLKGFKNINRVEYQVINVGDLNIFDDKAVIDIDALRAKNLIGSKSKPVKLLGGKGEIEKSISITLHKASTSAIEAVKAKGGTVTLLSE